MGRPGGRGNFDGYTGVLALLGTVASILIGATAGTQDVSNGVFRDLVVTGRARSTLFGVRIPGALLVFLPMLAVGVVLAIGVTYGFAGDRPTPSASYVWHSIAYAAALTVVNLVVAIGLAAFMSSRVVVGVLIAWNTIVAHLLLGLDVFGRARKLIDVAAAEHFSPSINDNDQIVSMSSTTAVLVLLGWMAIFFVAGRWWTERRDA